jgi:hypothetical protein
VNGSVANANSLARSTLGNIPRTRINSGLNKNKEGSACLAQAICNTSNLFAGKHVDRFEDATGQVESDVAAPKIGISRNAIPPSLTRSRDIWRSTANGCCASFNNSLESR